MLKKQWIALTSLILGGATILPGCGFWEGMLSKGFVDNRIFEVIQDVVFEAIIG